MNDAKEPKGEVSSLGRLVPLTVALCTTLFCVSLVTKSLHLKDRVNTSWIGCHDSSNSYSQNNNLLRLSQRRGMVWQFIHVYHMRDAAHLWQIIYILSFQMGVSSWAAHFRNRISNLRRGAYFKRPHRGKEYCRIGSRRLALGMSDYSGNGCASCCSPHLYGGDI